MKYVYLVRASGERIGPFIIEKASGNIACLDGAIEGSVFLKDVILKALGFTIEPAEEKPKVARYWCLVRLSLDGGSSFSSCLATQKLIDLNDYIKDPTRPDPIYLEEF